jgi:adenylosuccinate synthase
MTKKNIVIVGTGFGDESKAKWGDVLAKECNVVVRFSGTNNAGHTVIVNGKKVVFHLVPCGMLYPHTINVIANGVSLDPFILWKEIEELRSQGIEISPNNLKISGSCLIISEIHKSIDAYEEEMRGKNKIGTTKTGSGPVAVDKVSRRGLRMMDLVKNRVKLFFDIEQYKIAADRLKMNKPYEQFIAELQDISEKLSPFVCDTSLFLSEQVKNGGVLFEGSQGTFLDIDHGSYPYITSSNCIAASAAVGSGIGPQYLNEIIGVSKCYLTRVGAGPYPTQMEPEMDELVRKIGKEVGATTGRPRKCGWLSLVDLRYAARINGLTSLAMSKFDVFSDLPEIKLCVSYTIDGQEYKEIPMDHSDLFRATPNYITLPSWKGNLSSIKNRAELPKELLDFIAIIEKEVGLSIKYISTGAERDQVIDL